jgi:uncharacterized protein YegL
MITATDIKQALTGKKQNNVKAKNTYVAIVLDKSGSMNNIRDNIVQSLNEQISTIRKWDKEILENTKVTFTVFSDTPNVSFLNRPVNTLKEISRNDYLPSGSTALNDAIVETLELIEKTVDINDEDSAFLVLVLTDGGENHSKRYPYIKTNEVKDMINKRKDTGRWTFTYIGTEDLNQVNATYGFDIGNSMNFVADANGTKIASARYSKGLQSYGLSRACGQTMVSNMLSDDSK